MTHSEIHAFLKLAKVSISRLAREVGVNKADIVKTINGHQKNEALRQRIAARFGLTVDEFFGADFEAVTALRSKRKAA
jgi:transcriptional regulator with XRE-family HTH domain